MDQEVLDKSADLVALDKSVDLVELDASMVRVALAELVELAILARLMMATTVRLAEDNYKFSLKNSLHALTSCFEECSALSNTCSAIHNE